MIECPYGDEQDSQCKNNDNGYCKLDDPIIKDEGQGYCPACMNWNSEKK